MTTLKTTRDAIKTTLNAMLIPFEISQARIEAALSALFDELDSGERTTKNESPIDRVVTIKEACAILARSQKTVSSLAKRGKIRPVYTGKDAQRACGYSAASIKAFLDGKAA